MRCTGSGAIGRTAAAAAPRSAPARRAGFSLIELLITLALIGVLAGLVSPVAQTLIQRGRERELSRSLLEIRRAIDDYKRASDDGRIAKVAGASGYPASLGLLVAGAVDLRDPLRGKIYFLRRLPRDPLQADSAGEAEASWGKRSYASDADQPQEGADVYDVYALSGQVGLNGVPYGKW